MPSPSCSVAGSLPDGRTVHLWRLTAPNGISADILTLGASLHALRCPDRDGRVANVLLGPRQLAQKLTTARYVGATIGRYANRIAHGRLPVDGGVLPLRVNEGANTLHGGPDGFDTRLWDASATREPAGTGVELRLVSPDGDQGFPGKLDVTVTYTLDDDGRLRIDYRATADERTPVNLTNHAYWNLAAGSEETVLDHDLAVAADHYLPVDAGLLPLPGAPSAVAGTPFDLTEPRRIRAALAAPDDQLRLAGGGFDHNWVLRPGTEGALRTAAVLSHAGTGRRLECLTTEPGLQVYTGNGFGDAGAADSPDRAVPAASDFLPVQYAAVALETQHFPDSPRRQDFPDTWLEPGDVYRSATVYRLGTGG